ncbi:uncharacterized protein [Phaseolus vulgaris]|uniref:uncharacterized protein n=1 Tax=Phaseolus vulgaris TaxID=3885 RepID=UPI0035CA232E
MPLQMRQLAPANANKSTTPFQQATFPEFSTPRAHFPNPFANQNARGLHSAEQHQAMLSLQNQTQNLLGRGRVERPWDATSFESGKGSSSKRQRQTNSSPPNQGPNAGLALPGPSNAPAENPRLLDLINSSGNNREFMSNSLYDPAYETLGLPVDPHLRMFQAMAARGEKGYRMYD